MTDAKKGVTIFLSKLDESTLFALEKTVTQGFKTSDTTEEAIQNIIKHSIDEISILRRKLVTRQVLFDYLDSEDIEIRLPTTKNDLIDKIAEYWNISRLSSQADDNTDSSKDLVVRSESKNDINEMANQFTNWFYDMLNSGECGAEHFYSDSKLKLNMFQNGEIETNSIENNPDEIVNCMLELRQKNKLYLNLNNTKDGIQGRIDSHGLVVIMACGTLHIESVCAGVFEQVFALARDPLSENNWKIKHTELNLRSRSKIAHPPRLCDSELTSKMLALPSE